MVFVCLSKLSVESYRDRHYRLIHACRDDLLNLSSEEMAKQKTPAEDLTEGKFSYPVILALQGRRLQDDEVLSQLMFFLITTIKMIIVMNSSFSNT